MRDVVAESHCCAALQKLNGEGVWERRVGGLDFVVGRKGRRERIWGCEGDSFGFDEMGKFKDDGVVVQVREVGR